MGESLSLQAYLRWARESREIRTDSGMQNFGVHFFVYFRAIPVSIQGLFLALCL